MLLNETKGSLGMFSSVGRSSTEKYHILSRKDEIINGKIKKKVFSSNFDPEDENLSNFTEDEDEKELLENYQTLNRKKHIIKIDIKKEKKYNEIRKEKVNKVLCKKGSLVTIKNNSFNNLNKQEVPNCTKYNPKYSFIWNKPSVGPSWDSSLKKNFSIMNLEKLRPEFYLSHQIINVKGKNLVEMDKMTTRKLSLINNKIQKSNEKTLSVGGDSEYDTLRPIKTAKQSPNIKAIDFKKIVSREKSPKQSMKKRLLPFLNKKYEVIRRKPVVLCDFRKMLERRENSPRKSYENITKYNPDKILEKINNHRRVITPDFSKMTSRHYEGPLPIYMHKIYNRHTSNLMNENSFRMNNWKEGKFSSTQSSFQTKKSFNSIVNLNLITSRDKRQNNNSYKKYITKSMKFYDKSYEELTKENLLKKIDGVTLKAIGNLKSYKKREFK